MNFPSDMDYYEALNGPDSGSLLAVCAVCGREFWVLADDPSETCTNTCAQRRVEFEASDCDVRRA